MLFTGTFSFITGIIVLAFVVWLFGKSVKLLLKFILNSLVGFIILLLFNFFGGLIGVHLPINLITAFVTGVFGIIGILILLILKYIFFLI